MYPKELISYMSGDRIFVNSKNDKIPFFQFIQ